MHCSRIPLTPMLFVATLVHSTSILEFVCARIYHEKEGKVNISSIDLRDSKCSASG